MQLVFIGLGGAFGALLRYFTGLLFTQWKTMLPFGTWTANLLGCFLIGLALPYAFQTDINPSFRLFFVTGFLGAYTTFSTFSLETVELLQRGEWAWAAPNVGASVTLGLLMTALGMYVGKQFA